MFRSEASDARSGHLDLDGVIALGVEHKLVIHPYVGPDFSVKMIGPSVVPWCTNVSWVMTFIVKDNGKYNETCASVLDSFGPQISYIPSSVMGNLVTKPMVTTSYNKQVNLRWSISTIEAGEAYMLQLTIYTSKDKCANGVQGFSCLGQNHLDFGAILNKTGGYCQAISLFTPPILVKAIKPI